MRIVLVPVFALAFVLPGETARLAAFAVFCIAGASDALDGFAARKLNAGSAFGRMLDPIADKILVAVALMMLVAEGSIRQFNLTMSVASLLRLVPALIILTREILVSGLREFLAGAKVSVPVTAVAKFKTAIQMVGDRRDDPDAAGRPLLPRRAGGVLHRLRLCDALGRSGAHSLYGLRLFPRRAPAPASMTVVYFAWVRQKIGRADESVALPEGVATVRALAEHLAQRGGGYAEAFADPKRLRAAVNQVHAGFDAPICDGDEVAFFPPVTGG